LGYVFLCLDLGFLVDIDFMDPLIGAVFGQLSVEKNTGGVWL
jgi:hypothetical protein